MSDLGSIGILAALGFLFVVFLASIKGLIEQLRNRNKQPKTSISESINSEKEDRELSREDSEFDGEILFDDPLFPPEEDYIMMLKANSSTSELFKMFWQNLQVMVQKI